MNRPPNIQSGALVAETSSDPNPTPVSAQDREGTHYETDADQIVKVVHQVKPSSIPLDSPAGGGDLHGPQSETTTDIKVTPTAGSVHEATPRGT